MSTPAKKTMSNPVVGSRGSLLRKPSILSTPTKTGVNIPVSSNLSITTPPFKSNESSSVALKSSNISGSSDKFRSGLTTSAKNPLTSSGTLNHSENPEISSLTSSITLSPSKVTRDDLIKVCVRIRPIDVEKESSKDSGDALVWGWKDNLIYSIPPITAKQYALNPDKLTASPAAPYVFDQVFDPNCTNQQIFESTVQQIVISTMQGFHGSVYCYGQTSTGKTYTMNGVGSSPGIIPQTVHFCFNSINSYPDREFLIRVSYLEVYNEQIKDLLSSEPTLVKIQHDPRVGTVLSGVKEQVVLNYQQVFALIKAGEAQRHVGVTDMNEKSSRAHTLFKIIIESKDRSGKNTGPVRVSTLSLVDLAGSENAKMTNSKGERAREAKYINQSLLTLSTIIQRLSEDHHIAHTGGDLPRRLQHLPYRDSKLTRLLESSLDGNGRIAIICTISPMARFCEESANTLKFGTRAKLIHISAKVNETVDDKTLLRVYREEIEQLRMRLRELEDRQSLSSTKLATITSDTEELVVDIKLDDLTEESALLPENDAIEEEEEEAIRAAQEEEQTMMLQMISEMERMILKADLNKAKKDNSTSGGLMTRGSPSPSGSVSQSSASSFPAANNQTGSADKSQIKASSLAPDKTSDPSLIIKTPLENSSESSTQPKSEKMYSSRKSTGSSASRGASVSSAAALLARAKSLNSGGSSAPSPSLSPKEETALKPKIAILSKASEDLSLPSGSLDMQSTLGNPRSSQSAPELSSVREESREPNTAAVTASIDSNRVQPLEDPNIHVHGERAASEPVIDTKLSSIQGLIEISTQLTTEEKESTVEDHSVLLGVSKMLLLLKDFIAKPKISLKNHVARRASSSRLSGEGVPDELQQSLPNSPTKQSGSTDSTTPLSSSDYDNLRFDLKLKEADNQFLQEELDNKDKMLALLTVGLKEVEESQKQWLAANQSLSAELHRTLEVNDMLRAEVVRLHGLLEATRNNNNNASRMSVLTDTSGYDDIELPEDGGEEEEDEEEAIAIESY